MGDAASASRLAQLLGERERHFDRFSDIVTQRNNLLSLLHGARGAGSEIWRSRRNLAKQSQTRFDTISDQLGRARDARDIGKWFWVVALVLVLVEALINLKVVNNVMKQDDAVAYVIAAVLALVILALAHGVGHQVRHAHSAYKRKWLKGHIAWAAVLSLVLLAFVTILTVARSNELWDSAREAFGGIFAEGGEAQRAKVGFSELLTVLLSAFSHVDSLFYAGANTICIVATIYMGASSYDSDKYFDDAFRQWASAEERFEKFERDYQKARLEALTAAIDDLDRHRENYGSAKAAVITSKSSAGIPLETTDHFDIAKLNVIPFADDWRTSARPVDDQANLNNRPTLVTTQ